MKKCLIALLLLLLVSPVLKAQKRDWAVGLRLGDPAGINVRKYFGSNTALDVNFGSTGTFYGGRNYRYSGYRGYYNSGVALMVNYVKQKEITSIEGLEWYWGLGGQLSGRRFYYDDDEYYRKYGVPRGAYRSTAALGATGLVGLEWFIPDTQFSIYGDLGLYLEVVPAPFWIGLPTGVGGRFHF